MCGNRKMDTTSFIYNMVEYSLGMIMFLLLTYRFLSNWGEVMGWACYWVTKAWSVWSSATSVGWFLSLCVYACVFTLFWLPPVKLLTPIVTKHTWRSIKVQDKAKQNKSVAWKWLIKAVGHVEFIASYLHLLCITCYTLSKEWVGKWVYVSFI